MIIGVAGAGVMGRGIAQLFAQSGHEVRLFDAQEGAAAGAHIAIIAMLERLRGKGSLSEQAFANATAQLTICKELAEFAGCDVIIEAIVEDLAAKQSLFAALEAVAAETTILASNTSSLLVSAIAARCQRPERVAGLHFFNPVPLMKIAEIIPGIRTAPHTAAILRELLAGAGHQAVTAADQPGFLINHAGRGLYGEGFRIVEEGVADFAAVDRILRDGCGFRMGPFELMDLTGLDVSGRVMQSIFEQFQHDPRYRPSSLVPPRLAAGLFGRKTGEGFYKYDDGARQDLAEPPVPAAPRQQTVWVAASPRRDELVTRLNGAGATIIEQPDDAGICVLLPWGEDITTTALTMGLDPARCLGVDPLPDWRRRLVLMASPATSQVARDALHHLLATGGAKITVIADSPGFVTQRVVAMIVNIACEIAQRGIADAAEIDPAIRIGLGYPLGPLQWGDSIGPQKILAILQALQTATGDPRYRPSLWLRRRALLGLSLLDKAAG